MDTFDTQTDNGEERFHESEEPTQMIKGIRNIFELRGSVYYVNMTSIQTCITKRFYFRKSKKIEIPISQIRFSGKYSIKWT